MPLVLKIISQVMEFVLKELMELFLNVKLIQILLMIVLLVILVIIYINQLLELFLQFVTLTPTQLQTVLSLLLLELVKFVTQDSS